MQDEILNQLKEEYYNLISNEYSRENASEGLKRDVENEIETQCVQIKKEFENSQKLNSIRDSMLFLEKECGNSQIDKNIIANHFSSIAKEIKNINIDFFLNKIYESNNIYNSNVRNDTLKSIIRAFLSKVEQEIDDYKLEECIKKINNERKTQIEKLIELIKKYGKLKEIMEGFATGRLWDKSIRDLEESGFDLLKYVNLLNRDSSLRELAKILGKQNNVLNKIEKELRTKVIVRTEYHPQRAYRGKIAGLRLSDDISSLLPSELALFKHNKTKKIFDAKYVEKKLISYSYENDVPESISEEMTEEVLVSKEEKESKGPIIICVDTSGSMSGEPENIAKAITFLLSSIAYEEKRNCFVISFSVGIEKLDLSYNSGIGNLDRLVSFLNMSFHGGTDVEPALSYSLEMLKTNNYKNADVLMISDFVANNLGNDIVNKVQHEREKGTEFYSLVIGNFANNRIIDCFDYNFNYNISDANANEKAVKTILDIKNAKKVSDKSWVNISL